MPTATGAYATLANVKARLGIVDAADDALLASLCDDINQWIETTTGRVLAPFTYTSELFDGDGSRVLILPRGIRTLTSLDLAPYTGAPYVPAVLADVFLRPVPSERHPGWPASELWMSDVPSAGNTYPFFPRGFATVRLSGAGGPAAIFDDVAELANVAVVKAWHARQSGQTDIVGTDETGAPLVSRFVSLRDLRTLRRYTYEPLVVI